MLFSHRKGFKEKSNILQQDSVSPDLRTRLFNVLFDFYNEISQYDYSQVHFDSIYHHYWIDYFCKTKDTIPDVRAVFSHIKNYFFECEWYEIYDFLEFSAKLLQSSFCEKCNKVLEKENSAYRFVNKIIIEISSEVDKQSIEDALKASQPFYGVKTHIETAISHLADRNNPDLRNSIKESISAVEAISKIIANKKNAKLSQALDILEQKIGLDPALKKSFSSLYGYTSEKNGIRHALMNKTNLKTSDAVFMLVVCSAFVNYIISKSNELGLNLKKSYNSA